jgi:hypothetical protein
MFPSSLDLLASYMTDHGVSQTTKARCHFLMTTAAEEVSNQTHAASSEARLDWQGSRSDPTRVHTNHTRALAPGITPIGEILLDARSEPDLAGASEGILHADMLLLADEDVSEASEVLPLELRFVSTVITRFKSRVRVEPI